MRPRHTDAPGPTHPTKRARGRPIRTQQQQGELYPLSLPCGATYSLPHGSCHGGPRKSRAARRKPKGPRKKILNARKATRTPTRSQAITPPPPPSPVRASPPPPLPPSPLRPAGLRWRRPESLLPHPRPPQKRHPRSGGARRRAAPPSSTSNAAASVSSPKTLPRPPHPPAGTPTPLMTMMMGQGAGGGGRSASRASSPASLRSGSSLSRANFSKIPGFGDLPEGVLAAGHAAMRSRSGWICGLGIFLGGVLWYGSPPWWGI